jgi:hypothetical protein
MKLISIRKKLLDAHSTDRFCQRDDQILRNLWFISITDTLGVSTIGVQNASMYAIIDNCDVKYFQK